MAERSSELRSNPSNSVEWESGHILESVAETEGETCLGDGVEGQGCSLPTDDDIEKSFRVNQDGSMTVEMKVRLTLKEEETIHWTTTLTRSSVANELNETSLPPPELEQISSPDSLDLQSAVASIDTISKDKSKDNNDEDPPTPCNGVFSECSIEDDNIKEQTGLVSSWRAPTPGHKQIRTKQTSMESIKSVTAEGIQEGVVGSYSYREQTEHGDMTEQYCLVKQSSTRPVPKPRRLGSIDTNNISSRDVSTFKSAGRSEILQVESSGQEVTETVFHIFEQQTCQNNFLANLCAQGMSASGVPFCRPATSETGRFSTNNGSELELWRPSTASESISLWRAGSTSLTSDLTMPLLKTGAIQETNAQRRLPKPSKGRDKPKQTEIKHDKKPKLIRKRVIRLRTPKKRKKGNSSEATENHKKVKTFSSAGFLRRIYGNKSKSEKSTMKIKKGAAKNGDQGYKTKSSQQSDDTLKSILKDPNMPSALNEIERETDKSRLNVAPIEMIQPRGILTRQTSMHQEKKMENESYDISKSMSLPAFNSSSAFTHEYVENWLGQANFEPTTYPDEESKKAEEVILVKKEDDMSMEAEIKNSVMIVAKEVNKCLENTSDRETCETLKINPPPENVQASSVKQRIQSFENKSSPLLERTTLNQQSVHSHTTPKNSENYSILSQEDTTINKTPSDCSSGSPVKISPQNATPDDTILMDFPPPPSPPAEDLELSNTEYCVTDVSSAASSPLYRLSSVSSQMSDSHPLSISPASEKAASPTDLTMERTTSARTNIPSEQGEPPLPLIKMAPLVSNLSLGRTMALRKTCMDKYALCSDATSETSTAAAHINVVGNDVLQNGLHSTDTSQHSEPLPDETWQSKSKNDEKSQLCLTFASPASLTSEERMQSASISSDDHITPREHTKESKCNETPLISPTAISSPKPQVKKVQLMSSPSPERKSETRKLSSEISQKSPKLSSFHNRPPNMSPNVGRPRYATPNASPSTRKKPMLHHQQPQLQKRLSPYSQSLDVVSPPVRHRSSKKLLSRNHSSDDTSVSSLEAHGKTSSGRKNSQTPQSVKSTGEPDKKLSCNAVNPVEANQSDDNKVKRSDDPITAGQEKETQILPQPFNMQNQPDIKSVLEDICYSIKSIRLITQTKRPSGLERSNSLPDFSSHVASTFGSSSKALLAFLAVMTLKEGLTNLNMDEQNANNVSCAEALKMIDSLKEIASIEDSHKLKDSLSTLQQAASKQLLQSWKGFQELSDECKSRSSTPYDSEQESVSQTRPEKDCGIDKDIMDKVMDNLDMPEKLKEELASFSLGFKSDKDEKECRIIKKMEPPLNKDINTKLSHLSAECTVTDKDVTHEEKAHFNVSSIIKQFTEQSKQSRAGGEEETVKHKLPDQPIKENNGHYRQNSVATSPPAESGVSQRYSTELSMKENTKGVQSCYEGEERQQQDNNRDKSRKDWANMNRVSSNKNIEQDGCTSEVEEMEGGQLQMNSEESESAPDNELTHHDYLGSELEVQSMSSANKGLEVSCDGDGSSSDERQSSEEGAEVECEEIQQESDDSSKPENCSEVEEDKQLRFSYSVEEPSNQVALSYSASPLNSEKELHGGGGLMGQSISVNDSTCNSDVDEPTSEEEQHEAECQDQRVMNEESLSNDEDEQESTVEEEHFDDLLDHEEKTEVCKPLTALTEETVEDEESSEEEDYLTDKTQMCDKTGSQNTVGGLSIVTENQGLYNKKDSSNLIKLADEDSGNDHNSCLEHVEVQQRTIKVERIRGSHEEELRCYGKDSSSEEEHIIMDIYVEENCIEMKETVAFAAQSEDTKCEKAVEKPKHHSDEILSQTVAERVTLLEKQVANCQTRRNSKESSPKRHFSHRNVPLEPKVVDSPKSQSAPCSRSAPQSSLSFSYDSTGVITKEPEGNRVRSIREMFLAKSATDIQQGHRPFPSPNSSELVELRAQTSTSAGYQSQTSSELSSSEDDSAQKSISKGFVRRTIERLYGMRNGNTDQEANERPPSAPKETKNERSSIFSPFHLAQAKAMPELSYFNSTSALDNLTEATRCIAFNAKVVPGHCVPINTELFFISENTQIKKSLSDPVGINKTFTNSPRDEGMVSKEKSSYSLPSKESELEDKELSPSRKCTYFSLPHASDSDAWQEDISVVSKGSANDDSIIDTKDDSEDTKMPAERNGMLPNIGVTDFKKMDNKVHPLVELPADGEVVVVQPGKGHGVMNRRLQEPDVLDLLYDFCGQNCPVL
ncbi:uro-adherence factor A-like [Labrus bergylta]|uniref:uro-adherence factor A-like n=1 Tax=Labrus bergylta TaxID=56723 RepID=UPI0033131F66